MTIVKNIKITSGEHLQEAIGYALGDKISIAQEHVSNTIQYVQSDKPDGLGVYTTLVAFQNIINKPYDTFCKYRNEAIEKRGAYITRAKDGKEPVAWHYIQNFGTEVDPVIANEIGIKLAAEVFADFPVVIGTHNNTDYTHNHFIVNAWNLSGGKWNQCNSVYNKIRAASDRICQEYGLPVLDGTKEMRLIKYQDKNGREHYFEPTERNAELIKKRENGELVNGDLSDYRNTPTYEKVLTDREQNKTTVQNDIDYFLPTVTSYEELLAALREFGYEIKDKKKNGDWLVHVSYKAPFQENPTRDNRIGDGVFYTRENLQAYFADKEKTQERDEYAPPKYFEHYEYGEFDIDDIDVEYKSVKGEGDSLYTIHRPEAERVVIYDAKLRDIELKRSADWATITKIIDAQKQRKPAPLPSKSKQEILIMQIRESFTVLKFIENNNIGSLENVNDRVKDLLDKRGAALENIDTADKTIAHSKMVLELPDKIATLEARISDNPRDLNYSEGERNQDKQTLKGYREIAAKYKLHDPQERFRLSESVANSEKRKEHLTAAIQVFDDNLLSYQSCMRVLERAMKNEGIKEIEFERNKQILKEAQEKERQSSGREKIKLIAREEPER